MMTGPIMARRIIARTALLAINPFAPTVQTAARLRGCDRSARPRRMPPMPFKVPPIGFDHGG
jgi:hypothetical protein